MPWLLSTTFITQLNGVQDQESLLPPLGQGGTTLTGCSVLKEACELKLQITNPSSEEYYYSSRSQYQGGGGEERRRRRDESTDSAVMNNNFVKKMCKNNLLSFIVFLKCTVGLLSYLCTSADINLFPLKQYIPLLYCF